MARETGSRQNMPDNLKKRRRAPPHPKPGARNAAKRQKANDAGTIEKEPVKLDALNWQEVGVSGLDDYEGFYGLEEIDDVEVLKSGDTGVVSFRQKPSKPTEKKEKHSQRSGDVTAENDESDEWGGFDDLLPEAQRRHDRNGSEALDEENAFDVLPTESPDEQGDADVTAWQPLGLSSEILAALARLGFSRPTAIQSSAIPSIQSGQDVIGKAPTGSGKTLAFGLPIIEQYISLPKRKTPIALIIEPTRELAHQIATHLNALKSTGALQKLAVSTLTGGLSIQKQRRLLEIADIVVATPGRLWEVIEGHDDVLLKLKQIKTLVVDEADRLLSQGHFKELEQVLTALDRKEIDEDGKAVTSGNSSSRQTLVFSATLARELQQKLAKQSKSYQNATGSDSMSYLLKKLNFRGQPQFVDVNPTAPMAERLKEAMLEVPTGTEKDLYLYAALLLHRPFKQTRSLVFVNSISAVRRIVPFLKYLNLDAIALHSQMEQKARLRSVEKFSGAKTTPGTAQASILVATDVAARGLDIPEVHTVIHYHVPRTADGYIHRSGRTARAEASGTSILICAPQEAAGVRRLVAQVHAKKSKHGHRHLHMIEPEGRIISQLKPRAALAKKIADAEQAKEKQASRESWMAEAADDLGVDLDEEDMEQAMGEGGPRKKNKGKKRKEREAEGRSITKAELREAKASLRDMLSTRVNAGVSARYLTSGNVDIAALLRQREQDGLLGGGFLGQVSSLI